MFGKIVIAQQQRRSLGGNTKPVPVEPGPAWTGAAGSGFSVLPSDPTRSTAKPWLHMIAPPRQRFTDTLDVMFYAGAIDDGSLLSNLGLSHVRVHFEGSEVDIVEPSVVKLTRPDGSRYACYCWRASLTRPEGLSGDTHLYAEAVPADATMQSRVIGPFLFSMHENQHDAVIEVAPSLPQIFGSRYPDINTAANYCRSQGYSNPLVQVIEPGDYALSSWSGYRPQNYITVEGSVAGVQIVGTPGWSYRPSNLACFTNEVWWRNVTFEYENVNNYTGSGGNGEDPVFESCTFQNSAGREQLWAGTASRQVGYIVSANPYFLECDLSNLPNVFNNVSLARACILTRTTADISLGGKCIIGCTIDDHDPRHARSDYDALSLQYTGAEASATITIPGNSDGNNRTVTLAAGGTTASFTLRNDEASHTAASAAGFDPVAEGYGYFNRDFAAWINAQSDWTATLIDDTHRATSLSIAGNAGKGFFPVDAKSGPLTLVNCFDFHADLYQQVSATENIVFADNSCTYITGQNFFIGSAPLNDAFFGNNLVTNPFEVETYWDWAQGNSGTGSANSHVVIAHNTMPTQRFTLPMEADSNYLSDAYCTVANNAFQQISGGSGVTLDGDVSITANAIWGSAIDHGEALDVIKGGDQTSWFRDFSGSDFAAAGELAGNQRTPLLRFDLAGRKRGNTAAVGALT